MIPKLELYKERWNVLSDPSIKPGLDAMKDAMKLLGNPELKVQCVHLAGTNGKGSTLTFIEQMALQHGLTVGKFMSPCIIDIHDQLQINGTAISEENLDHIFKQMKDAGLSGKLTDFELLTCAAFLYFAQQKVDLALIEAGMGGKEDSTNVISPIVSIIPSIALEHTKFLGTTIESIAIHKAGIIKPLTPIVVGALPEQAFQVIHDAAVEKEAPLLTFGVDFDVSSQLDRREETYRHRGLDVELENLRRSLPGKHQANNMALAITAFYEIAQYFNFDVDADKIRYAVERAKVRGRFEEVLLNVYFDGAHNPASADALVETIRQQFPNEPIRFVIGMLADKEVEKMLRVFEQVSDEFYFVDFPNERAMAASDMLAMSKSAHKKILDDPMSFIQQASSLQGKTFVTGSLYLLAKIRQDFS